MHDVKPAAAVIADDVICQSFIQSSSTLAYACLLIRQRKFDLASHVLHSLEAKQASRFKDMVFYLQAQIGIETGEYATVKKRLVPRVHQHANDMVALSLLECCIYHEFAEWDAEHPAPSRSSSPGLPEAAFFPEPPADSAFGNSQAASAAAYAATYDDSAPEPVEPVVSPGVAAVSAAPAPFPSQPEPDLIEIKLNAPLPQSEPAPKHAAAAGSALGREATAGHRAAAPSPYAPTSKPAAPNAPSGEVDMGFFQTLANDANTHGLALWNHSKGKSKSVTRNPDFEGVLAVLPGNLPGAVQAAATALEGGSIHKICFCFQHLTATTFHAGAENMGLITGNINQSLLTIVRAENTFRKSVPAMAAAAAARSAEAASSE